MQIRTRYFEITFLTRHEWTKRMILEHGRLKAIKMYMDRYKVGLKEANKYTQAITDKLVK